MSSTEYIIAKPDHPLYRVNPNYSIHPVHLYKLRGLKPKKEDKILIHIHKPSVEEFNQASGLKEVLSSLVPYDTQIRIAHLDDEGYVTASWYSLISYLRGDCPQPGQFKIEWKGEPHEPSDPMEDPLSVKEAIRQKLLKVGYTDTTKEDTNPGINHTHFMKRPDGSLMCLEYLSSQSPVDIQNYIAKAYHAKELADNQKFEAKVSGMDIPDEVYQAAQTVTQYFAEHNPAGDWRFAGLRLDTEAYQEGDYIIPPKDNGPTNHTGPLGDEGLNGDPLPYAVCPYAESVSQKILKRAAEGFAKYGTNLAREDLSIFNWLIHLQEELMDAANYVEVLLNKKL